MAHRTARGRNYGGPDGRGVSAADSDREGEWKVGLYLIGGLAMIAVVLGLVAIGVLIWQWG